MSTRVSLLVAASALLTGGCEADECTDGGTVCVAKDTGTAPCVLPNLDVDSVREIDNSLPGQQRPTGGGLVARMAILPLERPGGGSWDGEQIRESLISANGQEDWFYDVPPYDIPPCPFVEVQPDRAAQCGARPNTWTIGTAGNPAALFPAVAGMFWDYHISDFDIPILQFQEAQSGLRLPECRRACSQAYHCTETGEMIGAVFHIWEDFYQIDGRTDVIVRKEGHDGIIHP